MGLVLCLSDMALLVDSNTSQARQWKLAKSFVGLGGAIWPLWSLPVSAAAGGVGGSRGGGGGRRRVAGAKLYIGQH